LNPERQLNERVMAGMLRARPARFNVLILFGWDSYLLFMLSRGFAGRDNTHYQAGSPRPLPLAT
jgi:hypothetical protein